MSTIGHNYSGQFYERSLARAAAHSESLCRCGAAKEARHLVCRACWLSSPAGIRGLFQNGTVKHRRAALRVLLGIAGARRAVAVRGGAE